MTAELNEAVAHLITALAQVSPGDDKIIVAHMQGAFDLIRAAQYAENEKKQAVIVTENLALIDGKWEAVL